LTRNGKIKINSISKIRKIRVSKKNCREKKNRLFILGSNPHSNGLSLAKSIRDFWLMVEKIKIRANLRARLKEIS
jgi:hypothetical protein